MISLAHPGHFFLVRIFVIKLIDLPGGVVGEGDGCHTHGHTRVCIIHNTNQSFAVLACHMSCNVMPYVM